MTNRAEFPSLHDLATAADELHIPLRACRFLLSTMIQGEITERVEHIAVALRALVENADKQSEQLSAQLYERARVVQAQGGT